MKIKIYPFIEKNRKYYYYSKEIVMDNARNMLAKLI